MSEGCKYEMLVFRLNLKLEIFRKKQDFKINNLLQVFQCLLLEGENVGLSALKNAEQFYITDSQFENFLHMHKHVPMLVPESNEKVTSLCLLENESFPT